jgi:aspartate/methionine/tyrosine aminotransferase
MGYDWDARRRSRKTGLNPVFAQVPNTIFDTMSGLAREHGAINLGQGFPDQPGPEDIRAFAAEALMTGSNQYPPMRGLPELRAAVAAHYNAHQGLDLAPEEVVVTAGATEALAAALLALLSDGDEVVLFEPMYDAYLPLLRRAGAHARMVRLEPPAWRLTEAALEGAFTERTRVVVLNNPLNPAARLFDEAELSLLSRACVAHDVVALCDEVWEHVRFDGAAHRPLMAFPGMRERTVKVGSAGKIFSMTGWKVGWACAAPGLIRPVTSAHQYLTFTVPPNLQAAVAFGLAKPVEWFEAMRAGYQRSRDRLTRGLVEAGFAVIPSQATYFVCVDLAASGVNLDDEAFCRRAVAGHGVAAIPVSAFYGAEPVRNVIRLCFAKADDTLDEGVARLARAKRGL